MKNTSKHTAGKIGVGIIGASPDRGWALTAHVPALKSLPGYEIRAVSTTRRESAEAAARAFGAEQWFDNHQELVSSPKVDLVVVTVKVPLHFELVTAAIAAGKSVYCEWPLGNGTLQPLTVSDSYRHVPGDLPVPAVNVAEAYLRLENDLRDGTNSCPTFDDAVQLHRLLAAIEESAATGKRRSLASK